MEVCTMYTQEQIVEATVKLMNVVIEDIERGFIKATKVQTEERPNNDPRLAVIKNDTLWINAHAVGKQLVEDRLFSEFVAGRIRHSVF